MKRKYVQGAPHTKLTCAFEALCTNCGFHVCILSYAWVNPALTYQMELVNSEICPTCQHPISIGRVYIRRYRKPIPKRLRAEIIEQCDNKCAFCKSTKDLQIDHIIPIFAGGTNTKNNLRVLCRTCNLVVRDFEPLTRSHEGNYICFMCGREGELYLHQIRELKEVGYYQIRAYSVLLCNSCSYLEIALQRADNNANGLKYEGLYFRRQWISHLPNGATREWRGNSASAAKYLLLVSAPR